MRIVCWVVLSSGLAACAANPMTRTTVARLSVGTECVPESAQTALIFIHGWNGDALNTWRTFPRLACEDRRFHGSVAVLLYSYPTYFLKKNPSIVEIASNLNQEIETGGWWHRYHKVVIVAHSMGGIIARELVILRALEGDSTQVPGLVEIAVPHDGANPADLASALGIRGAHLDELAQSSQTLVALRTQWSEYRSRPTTYCFGSPQDKVVPEGSAFGQCDHIRPYLAGGHTEIVKPFSRDSDYYAFPMKAAADALGIPVPQE